MNNNQQNFLGYLHSFRGFAIINIVAIHAIGFGLYAYDKMSMNPKNPYFMANELIFHNSTIYFAVISGLLFSVVLKNKGYKRFYGSKFKNVLLPYVFLTLLFSIFNPTEAEFFILHTNFTSYLTTVLHNFILGKAMFQFWYIPVLMFLYLLTPVVDYILNIKKWGTFLILIIIFLPLIISRLELIDSDHQDFISFSSIIYFMGAYAAGIYFGINPEERFIWVKKNLIWFIIISILSSITILYFELKEIDKMGFWSLRATLFYIQKMCFSAVVIVLYKNLGEKQPRWLVPFANNAFAIYFLHVFFLFLIESFIKPISTWHEIAPLNLLFSSIIFLFFSLTMSIIVTWVIKKLFGRYSRMLIGS